MIEPVDAVESGDDAARDGARGDGDGNALDRRAAMGDDADGADDAAGSRRAGLTTDDGEPTVRRAGEPKRWPGGDAALAGLSKLDPPSLGPRDRGLPSALVDGIGGDGRADGADENDEPADVIDSRDVRDEDASVWPLGEEKLPSSVRSKSSSSLDEYFGVRAEASGADVAMSGWNVCEVSRDRSPNRRT